MSKIVSLSSYLIVNLIAFTLFFRTAFRRPDLSGLKWLSAAAGLSAFITTVYLLGQIQIAWKVHFFSPAIARAAFATCDALEYISAACYLAGVICLTRQLGKKASDAAPRE